MPNGKKPRYFLVKADMLPEVFGKVVEARELLKTGEAVTVAEAAERVGISRSAFYKYKDAVSPFFDMEREHIITFHVSLRDIPGVLSNVLSVFADSGANILTINQSIPTSGVAIVTISAETAGMRFATEELLSSVEALDGVIKIEVLAG